MTVYATNGKKQKLIALFSNGDVYRLIKEGDAYFLGTSMDSIPESGYEEIPDFPDSDSLISQHEMLQRYRIHGEEASVLVGEILKTPTRKVKRFF